MADYQKDPSKTPTDFAAGKEPSEQAGWKMEREGDPEVARQMKAADKEAQAMQESREKADPDFDASRPDDMPETREG